MKRILFCLTVGLAGCASSSTVPAAPDPDPSLPRLIRAEDIPAKIFELLSAHEDDDCGICVRDRQEEAVEIAAALFVPGTRIRGEGERTFRVLAGGRLELYFPAVADSVPRVTYRIHGAGSSLVGIRPGDLTAPEAVASIRTWPSDRPWSGTLEVVPFAYGDADALLLDEVAGRLQVQCRVVSPE